MEEKQQEALDQHCREGGKWGDTMRGLMKMASGAGVVLVTAYLFSRQNEGRAAKERRARLRRNLSEIKSDTSGSR